MVTTTKQLELTGMVCACGAVLIENTTSRSYKSKSLTRGGLFHFGEACP